MPRKKSSDLIRAQFERFKALPQYKGLPDTKIMELAEQSVKTEETAGAHEFLIDQSERAAAKRMMKRYMADYSIETDSDRNLLQQVVYLEIIQKRMQDQLNQFHSDNKAVPVGMVEWLQKNLDAIIKAKLALGLTKKDRSAEEGVRALDLLKKKFKTWRAENQASRTIVCPHCSQMVMLKIRTEAWEAQKHPLFKDRILGNAHLIRLYQEGKLSREDVASVLGTSQDYVDWMIEKWQKVDRTQQDIDVKEDQARARAEAASAEEATDQEEAQGSTSVSDA